MKPASVARRNVSVFQGPRENNYLVNAATAGEETSLVVVRFDAAK